MAAPKRVDVVVEKEVKEVEEFDVVKVYQAMLDEVDKIYRLALQLESGERAVAVLKGLEAVKASIIENIEAVQMERLREEDVRRYEAREVVKDE